MCIMRLILQVYKAAAGEVAGNLVSRLSCVFDNACQLLPKLGLVDPLLSLPLVLP